MLNQVQHDGEKGGELQPEYCLRQNLLLLPYLRARGSSPGRIPGEESQMNNLLSGRFACTGILILVLVVLSISCGGGGSNVTPPDNKTLSISGPTSLKVGQNGQYSATLNGQTVLAIWAATSGSITTAGLFTAPASAGQVTVIATYEGKTAQLTVTITADVVIPPPPSGDWTLLFEGTNFKPGETISLPAPGSAKFQLQGTVNGKYLNWDITVGPSGASTLPLGDPDAGPLVICQVVYSAPGEYVLRVSEFFQKTDYVFGSSPLRYAEWYIEVGNAGKTASSLVGGQRLFFTLP